MIRPFRESRIFAQTHNFVAAFAATILVLFGLSPVFGQKGSSDPKHPTMLSTKRSPVVLASTLDGKDDERYYGFLAGPGIMHITLAVKATGAHAGVVLDLLDKDGKPLPLDLTANAVKRGSAHTTKSFEMGPKELFILRIKGVKYADNTGVGTFRVTLTGANIGVKLAARNRRAPGIFDRVIATAPLFANGSFPRDEVFAFRSSEPLLQRMSIIF